MRFKEEKPNENGGKERSGRVEQRLAGGASENYSRRISLASTQAGVATRCLQKKKKKKKKKRKEK